MVESSGSALGPWLVQRRAHPRMTDEDTLCFAFAVRGLGYGLGAVSEQPTVLRLTSGAVASQEP